MIKSLDEASETEDFAQGWEFGGQNFPTEGVYA